MEMNTFFDKLSERKWNENDLSDVTWALCETNKKFKKLFLDFCFNTDTPEMESFEREIPSHDSRPDFYCRDKEQKEWILEVKIDDEQNLHFEQYRNEFPNAECAFIANYDAKPLCNKNLNFSITTWKDFIIYISKNVCDEALIIGYIKYLKKLTGFLEVENMDLNYVKSLPDFNATLENIIHEYSKKTLTPYNQLKSFFDDKFGRYAYYNNKNGKAIYFWIGIYFCDPKGKFPYLCLEFNVEDNNSVPKKEADIIKNLQDGNCFFAPDIYDGVAHFYIKDDALEILFSKKPEIEKQKKVIYNFLDEILEKI